MNAHEYVMPTELPTQLKNSGLESELSLLHSSIDHLTGTIDALENALTKVSISSTQASSNQDTPTPPAGEKSYLTDGVSDANKRIHNLLVKVQGLASNLDL